jgi:hypothetical protein
MLTNEKRAHDLAMFHLRNEYDKFVRSMSAQNLPFGEHSFDAFHVYLGAYKSILNQLDTEDISPTGHR